MNVQRCGVVLLALVCHSSTLGQPFADEGSRERGRALLAGLAELPEDFSRILYFELQLRKQAVGVARLSLKSIKSGDDLNYQYEKEITIRMPSKVIHDMTKATLTPLYEPIRIDAEQITTSLDNPQIILGDSVVVEADHIMFTKREGTAVVSRRVDRPYQSFVFGIDRVLERPTYGALQTFSLLVLNPAKANFIEYTFIPSRRENGDLVVRAAVEGASTYAFYAYGEDGMLNDWGQRPPLFQTERLSEASYKALIDVLNLEQKADEAGPKEAPKPPAENKPSSDATEE